MEADPVARRIGDPRHPADARLDGLDQDLHAALPAFRDRGGNVVHGKCDAWGAEPVPLGADGFRSAIEAEREGLGGEFAPELGPLGPAPPVYAWR